ncbi:MAG: TIGR01459 family HAD-type hydrolase [Pararhizobium sp.]
MLKQTRHLADITADYDVILSDVWGVVHNGVSSFPQACAALAAARAAGKTVILITNSPRPWKSVAEQLDAIGVPRESFDRIVTSGDVTRHLIADGPKRVVLIGPERDCELVAGIDVELVPEAEAEVVLCTGLFDDDTEHPEEYRAMLERLSGRGLPMICANPDLVVERGHRLVPCAGALATIYRELGGETRISGKPHRPIYEEAMATARALVGDVDKRRTLAIGDSILTDVKGAADYGLDILYIGGGIHAKHYAGGDTIDAGKLEAYLAEQGVAPRFWMQRLV